MRTVRVADLYFTIALPLGRRNKKSFYTRHTYMDKENLPSYSILITENYETTK